MIFFTVSSHEDANEDLITLNEPDVERRIKCLIRSEVKQFFEGKNGLDVLKEAIEKLGQNNCNETTEPQAPNPSQLPKQQAIAGNASPPQKIANPSRPKTPPQMEVCDDVVPPENTANPSRPTTPPPIEVCDDVVPATPECNERRISVMGSGLSEASKQKLSLFCDKFDVDIFERLSPIADYLVVETDALTLKVLYAKCRNIPIINMAWVIDNLSLSGSALLPTKEYELNNARLPFSDVVQKLDILLLPPITKFPEDDLKVSLQSVLT